MEDIVKASNLDALGLEWATLQNNVERYETGALALKWSAMLLAVLGLGLNFPLSLISAVILLIWLQEAVYRTFQARLGRRIVRVETLVRQACGPAKDAVAPPFQLHSEWLESRSSGLGLIREYLASALRPTVAYPYALVLLRLLALPVMIQGR